MHLAGNALDEIRRRLQADCSGLKGMRWAILGNEWNRSEEQQELRRSLCDQYPKLGRAMGLREALQEVLNSRDADGLRWL